MKNSGEKSFKYLKYSPFLLSRTFLEQTFYYICIMQDAFRQSSSKLDIALNFHCICIMQDAFRQFSLHVYNGGCL
ncbi:MAG TPA: hypothetical protein VLZ33_06990, partial [Dysgonamonadaceae bacterium]|nr:hypothetical protein [Dysgonamonadaceae bacterium]